MGKKYSNEYIRNYLKELGYEWLDDEYISAISKLTFKDKDGFIYMCKLNDLLSGHTNPFYVYKSNPYSIQNINLWLKLNNFEYEVISDKYINNSQKLILKDKYGYMYVSEWNSIQNKYKPFFAHKSNPYSIQNIKLWCELNEKDFELLSTEYLGMETNLEWKCLKSSCGEVFTQPWHIISMNINCPYCNGQRVGISNCLATKHPEIANQWHPTKNGNLTPYDIMTNSHTKVWWKCKDCGHEKFMSPNRMYTGGLGCDKCSDGISYPNKFMFNMLEQLNIEFKREYSPKWIGQKRYDFYIPSLNIIIEMDGGLGHGNRNHPKSKQTKEELIEIDKYKDNMAKEHGIEVIRIDCDYKSYNQFEFIWKNILSSKLSGMFDLNKINLNIVSEFSESNIMKEVCKYRKENPNINTTNIGDYFNINRNTIRSYLKRGNSFGWCYYNVEEEKLKEVKNKSKQVEVFKDNISLGIFNSITELCRLSTELFGIYLYTKNVSDVCNGKRIEYKGFNFKHIK